MFRIFLSCLLFTVRPRIFHIDPVLEDFNNIINLAGITALILPNIRLKNIGNKQCVEDKDCKGNKKCCQLYFQKFCCSPEKYIKIKPNIGY